jgi:hypothetical protein
VSRRDWRQEALRDRTKRYWRAIVRPIGPLDPLELALLLEAAEDESGLDRDETQSVDAGGQSRR